MTNQHVFEKASQRAVRGRKHIADAEAAFEAYLQDRAALTVRLSHDADDNRTTPTLIVGKSLPTEVVFAVADAFNNLRAALNTVWTLLLSDPDLTKVAPFPRAATEEKAAEMLLNDRIVQQRPILGDFIRKRVRPWPKGNPVIAGLFELARRDDHGLLDLAFASPRVIQGEAVGIDTGKVSLDGLILFKKPGTDRISWPGVVELCGEPALAVDLVFGPDEVFAGNNVFEGLKFTHNQVMQIILDVSRLVAADPPRSNSSTVSPSHTALL